MFNSGHKRERNLKHLCWTPFLFLVILVAISSGCGSGGGDGEVVAPPPGDTVTLSGTIEAVGGVTIDSDVNDPNESYSSNDTFATAQVVTNPVSVGGYLNRADYGAQGRSYSSGDRYDYYEVQLNANERIFLSIGDYDAGDLDLVIYDMNENRLDSSLGTGNSESLDSPGDGTYFVRVNAFSGASTYILTIGVDLASAETVQGALSTQQDFMAGQVVVRYAQSSPAAQSTQGLMNSASALGMTKAAGSLGSEILLTFDVENQTESVFQAMGIQDSEAIEMRQDPKLATLSVIKELRRRPDVLFADPNYVVQHCATHPDDTYYNLQWHYPQVNLPRAWDITTGSSNVIVAVVDTGVLMGHPDLSGRLTNDGYDFISQTSMSNDGDGIDNDPDDPGDSHTPGSSSFHGTHCAGTVAASTNNGRGLAGTAWNTRIMPIRTLGVGGGTMYDILQGVRYAAGMQNDSGTVPANTADIISMSLGGGGYSQTTQDLFTQVRNAGVILIAAAGNDATNTPHYPAAYDGVMGVSAVDINSSLASYSNFGSYVDIAAPGGDSGDQDGDGYADRVWSTCGDDSSGTEIQYVYAAKSGTSMATPHVAGVVSLMKAQDPTLTPVQLDSYLQNGHITNDIGNPGRDNYYGYGLIDAYKAVQVTPGATELTANPTNLVFGTTTTTLTLTISKVGPDDLSVVNVTEDANWLTVTASNVDADNLGDYSVRVNRAGLGDGTYTSDITITPSTGNTVAVPVNLRVSAHTGEANAGYHYVLLVDPDTMGRIQQDNVQVVNGRYNYSFANVAQGETYYIVAGSDRNNDGYIGDAGESLGAYSSLDEITTITADTNHNDLDFATDLRQIVPDALSVSQEDGDSGNYEIPILWQRIR